MFPLLLGTQSGFCQLQNPVPFASRLSLLVAKQNVVETLGRYSWEHQGGFHLQRTTRSNGSCGCSQQLSLVLLHLHLHTRSPVAHPQGGWEVSIQMEAPNALRTQRASNRTQLVQYILH